MSRCEGSRCRGEEVMEENDFLCEPLKGKMRHVRRDIDILHHCFSSSP